MFTDQRQWSELNFRCSNLQDKIFGGAGSGGYFGENHTEGKFDALSLHIGTTGSSQTSIRAPLAQNVQ